MSPRMRLFRRSPLVCRDAVALMTDFLENRLAVRDVRLLRQHLANCPHCTEYLEQLRVTITTLGSVTPDDLSDDALDAFVEIYREWRSDV